jgi:hypothetical protein
LKSPYSPSNKKLPSRKNPLKNPQIFFPKKYEKKRRVKKTFKKQFFELII